MILQLYTVYPHLCAKWDFQMLLLINFLAMSMGTSDTSGPTHIVHPDDLLTEMLHVTVL